MAEPRVAAPPAEFDTYQLVILRSPAQAPDLDDETTRLLFGQHLGHFANMSDAGHLMVSGPLSDQPDDALRGVCLYRVGSVEEARQLAEQDPAVQAGLFSVDVMTWRTAKGAVRFVR
ncbi:MAG TPA: YciI family protein [Mycobacteriales bacterium]|nr:YciI family protein [Mycobacteriales bacterium]